MQHLVTVKRQENNNAAQQLLSNLWSVFCSGKMLRSPEYDLRLRSFRHNAQVTLHSGNQKPGDFLHLCIITLFIINLQCI